MDTVQLLKAVLLIILILSAGFFSSAETALTAINKLKLRQLLEKDRKGSHTLLRVLKNPKRLLTGLLMGRGFFFVAAIVLVTILGGRLLSAHGFSRLSYQLTILAPLATLFFLVVTDFFPRFIALKATEKVALWSSPFMAIFLTVLTPFIAVLNGISTWLARLFRLPTETTPHVLTEDEIKTAVDLGEREGIIEKEEKEMIQSIFDFSDTVVREIMTPRTDAVFIDADVSTKDAIILIQEKGHSRIPVYTEKIDNVLGIVYAKDLLGVSPEDLEKPVRTHMRDPEFIPETKSIEALLSQMKRQRFHMAIVVDEYGGTSGLVTLEDIIEEIIGEIQDEYDPAEKPSYKALPNGNFVVDARMNIDDLGQKIAFSFPKSEDFDTVGGFIVRLMGKIPSKGERIEYENLVFTIKDLTKKRILSVELAIQQTDASDVGRNGV